jgi:hypothetical protein
MRGASRVKCDTCGEAWPRNFAKCLTGNDGILPGDGALTECPNCSDIE